MPKSLTDGQLEQVRNVVEKCYGCGDSAAQAAKAGIDPVISNAAVNLILNIESDERIAELHESPGLAMILGVTLAATQINEQRAALEAEIQS